MVKMLGISSIIIVVASFLSWMWYTRRRSDEPQMFPGAWPIIGHSHLFFGDSLHLWKLMKRITNSCMKNGHANVIYLGPIKTYFVTDLDDITKIANTCLEKDKYTQKFSKDLIGIGLLYSPVSIWKRHRKLINPTFNQQVLDGFISVFNRQARQLVKQMAVEINGEPFDQSRYLRPHSMETVCLTVINDEISDEDAKSFAKYYETYLNCAISRFQRLWLHWDFLYQFSSLKKKQDATVKVIRDKCDALLRKKRAQRNQNKYVTDKEKSGGKIKTFIDLMMELDDGELTDQEIRDQINTIIIAGHETSANVIAIALLLIGSYPEVQEKLYKELQAVFGYTDRDIEREDFSKLVYLEAVLKETMRYYNMVPVITRNIDQEVKLKHYTLLPGHSCFLVLHGVHRSPLWGPDVNEFNPERWLNPETLPANPNVFVAFSVGKRNCIGKTYAMMTMKAVCSHILRRYKIRSDHTKLILKLDIILKPATGHEISIQDRLSTK